MLELYLFETKFIDSGRAESHFREEEKETVRKREILGEDILRGEMEMKQRVKRRE